MSLDIHQLSIPSAILEITRNLVGKEGDDTRVYCLFARAKSGEGVLLYTWGANNNYAQERENYKSEIINKGLTIDKEETVDAHVILSLLDKATEIKGISEVTKNFESSELEVFNKILSDAVRYNASDIHFIHSEHGANVYYRVNRVIVPSYTKPFDSVFLHKVSNAGVSQSVDLSGTMSADKIIDVTLRDYEVNAGSGKELISIRIGRTGSQFGPHTVARIFRKREVERLENLGVDDDVSAILREAIQSEKGVIILCGPTGHGKSTTVNSLYDEIIDGRMIILLSDPIEETFSNPYITQKNVYPEIEEYSYISLLKSSLRQDPDVIGITEMRDKEVMGHVFASALTGHLMATTMHSADPFDALIRLIESGIDKSLLAESDILQCIASQRLLPRVCHSCGVLKRIDGVEYTVRNDDGCNACVAGTVGLQCVAEALRPDEKGRELIREGNITGLRAHVLAMGYTPMRERGRYYARTGVVCPYDAQKTLGGIFNTQESVIYKKPQYLKLAEAVNG